MAVQIKIKFYAIYETSVSQSMDPDIFKISFLMTKAKDKNHYSK